MTTIDLAIRGVDTLLFRDGRPFDTTAGGRAQTLSVPLPSTVAGFLRTMRGRDPDGSWNSASDDLKMRGPLLTLNGEAVFAAPADAVVLAGDARVMVLRPFADLPEGANSDTPGGMVPLRVTHEGKPSSDYNYWMWSDMQMWLLDEWAEGRAPEKVIGPGTDHRMHLKVDAEKGAANDGMLFSTEMVAFERHIHRENSESKIGKQAWSYLCRVEIGDRAEALTNPGALGGERRLAVVEPADDNAWPGCPEELRKRLACATHVRMILATPAIFERGWIPSWLDKTTKEGAPPGLENNITLKLISAAIPRRRAVSGWDISERWEGEHKPGRPKPVRWMAPAGAAYFFEVKGDPTVLIADAWLAPVSDVEETSEPHRPVSRNRDDGFGLALWGAWNTRETRK